MWGVVESAFATSLPTAVKSGITAGPNNQNVSCDVVTDNMDKPWSPGGNNGTGAAVVIRWLAPRHDKPQVLRG